MILSNDETINDQTINSKKMTQTNNTQIKNTQTTICPDCGFTENIPGVEHCLQCDRPLNFQRNRNKTSSASAMWSSFPLLLLLLISGGLGLLWRKNSASLQKETKTAITETAKTAKTAKTAETAETGQIEVKDVRTYASGLQLKESFADVTDVPQGVFFYGGAMGSAGIRSQNTLGEIAKAQPQFQLTYEDPLIVPPDSGTGIQMVIDGTISFAESFRPLKQSEYDLAQNRGFRLKQVPVATSAVAFYVNPNLNIPGLSLSQVERIYSGQITNWKQVGGPDLPIVPVSQDPDAKVATSFLLQGITGEQKKFSNNVRVVRDTTSAVREVSKVRGAIGYGAQPLVVNQSTVRSIGLSKRGTQNYIQPVQDSGDINRQAILDGSYPLIRRIFIILREDGEIDELAGRAYVNLLLSQEGQALIDRAGYLPVRYQSKQYIPADL